MTAPARFRQSDLQRALRAARDSGFENVRVILDPASGRMEVIVGKAANDESPVELD